MNTFLSKVIMASICLATAAFAATTAQAQTYVKVQTNPNAINVEYDSASIEVRDAGRSLVATGVYVYNNPKAKTEYGSYRQILVSATNGTAFCQALGHQARNTEGDGGEITCGEDESSYAAHSGVINSTYWYTEGTGSRNMCYPLYKSIECRGQLTRSDIEIIAPVQ